MVETEKLYEFELFLKEGENLEETIQALLDEDERDKLFPSFKKLSWKVMGHHRGAYNIEVYGVRKKALKDSDPT